jgi:hypothetical protein
MKLWICSLILTILSGCASVTTQRLRPEPLAPTETFYATFEFDRINLAARFHTTLRAQGFQVASSPDTADLLLTGTYSATHDVTHYRFDWVHIKLLRRRTGQTLALFQMGQGGLQSVDTGVKQIVKEIRTFVGGGTS